MWKSISSSGWEYLNVWKDLGLSLMYAIYVLFIYYCFVIYVIRLWNDIILELY